MSASAKRAAVKASSTTAIRGRFDERTWADVRRAAMIARDTGMALRVHGRCVDIIGELRQPAKMTVTKMEPKKHTAPKTQAAATPPQEHEEASTPAVSNRKQRSRDRLQEFQQRKKAELVKRITESGSLDARTPEERERRATQLVKLRSIFWRAWARYKPVYGGVNLGYTSLREQHVYNRASRLYRAAFGLDPGTVCRSLAMWLSYVTPMEQDSPPPAARSNACGAKKTRVG